MTTRAVIVFAVGFVPGFWPGTPFVEPTLPFETQFQQDFRRPRFDDSTLRTLGPRELLRPEASGLRITVSKGMSEDAERIGVAYPLPLAGDADVRASVELFSFPKPDEGYGTGVVLAVEDGVDRGGTLQFLRGDAGDRTYVAHHFVRGADGNYDHEVAPFPAASDRAILRLRRDGSLLRYLVSEDGGLTFAELKAVEFTDRPLKVVQLYGQRGGHPNALDARLADFAVASPQVTLRSEVFAPKTSTSWLAWIVSGASLLIVGLLCLVWYRRRRS